VGRDSGTDMSRTDSLPAESPAEEEWEHMEAFAVSRGEEWAWRKVDS